MSVHWSALESGLTNEAECLSTFSLGEGLTQPGQWEVEGEVVVELLFWMELGSEPIWAQVYAPERENEERDSAEEP